MNRAFRMGERHSGSMMEGSVDRRIVLKDNKQDPLAWDPLPDPPTGIAKERVEQTHERLAVYRQILETVRVPPWRLVEVGQSASHGASAYGYFTADGFPVLKVRLSDHSGKYSEFHLDVRHQSRSRMMDIVTRFLRDKAIELQRQKMKEAGRTSAFV